MNARGEFPNWLAMFLIVLAALVILLVLLLKYPQNIESIFRGALS